MLFKDLSDLTQLTLVMRSRWLSSFESVCAITHSSASAGVTASLSVCLFALLMSITFMFPGWAGLVGLIDGMAIVDFSGNCDLETFRG